MRSRRGVTVIGTAIMMTSVAIVKTVTMSVVVVELLLSVAQQ